MGEAASEERPSTGFVACLPPGLVGALYEELRAIASRVMGAEARSHTLQPTALVAETWLRLRDQRNLEDADREFLLGAAAVAMRRILVDHARARARAKRGAGWARVPLEALEGESSGALADVLEIDDALVQLERRSERQARIVELRIFGGLDMVEIARLLGVSRQTIQEEWRFARLWLAVQLGFGGGEN